jgi:hypothetical protein
MSGVDRRAVLGREIDRVEDVLDADGKPAKRRSGKARALRGLARPLDVECGKRADLRLALGDRALASLDDRRGRELSGRDAACEIERVQRLTAGPQGVNVHGRARR